MKLKVYSCDGKRKTVNIKITQKAHHYLTDMATTHTSEVWNKLNIFEYSL
jgi:hypothetical protein